MLDRCLLTSYKGFLKVSCLFSRLTALSTGKERQGQGDSVVKEEEGGKPWWNRGKERVERFDRELEEKDRQLDDQQREEVGEDEQELEGVRMSDTRGEVLSKMKEKEEVQRVMKQMLRSLSGMLKQ